MELSEKGRPSIEILRHIDSLFPQDELESSSSLSTSFTEFGLSSSQILNELDIRLSQDLSYHSGKILGAMSSPPHEFARYVYSRYMDRNLGDRGLNPGTAIIEQEVIHILGDLLGDPFVIGNIVAGGTEANLIAMYLAKQTHSHIQYPEVIIPDSAHYSFIKAAQLMGITLRRARLLPDFTLDMDHYASLVSKNTVGVVGIVGTSALGLIDPINSIAKLAGSDDLFFHVDGAFGGMVAPFLELLGHQVSPYSLHISEISSYTVDPHKMGLGVNPTGSILVRDPSLVRFNFKIPYLAGGSFPSFNILGTRPGASAISFWALLQYLGKAGFMQIVDQCWENTLYLRDQLSSVPYIEIATLPQMNVLGIQLSSEAPLSIAQLDQHLRQRGWALGFFREWDLLRVVVMPHVLSDHIDAFITDLKQILKNW